MTKRNTNDLIITSSSNKVWQSVSVEVPENSQVYLYKPSLFMINKRVDILLVNRGKDFTMIMQLYSLLNYTKKKTFNIHIGFPGIHK